MTSSACWRPTTASPLWFTEHSRRSGLTLEPTRQELPLGAGVFAERAGFEPALGFPLGPLSKRALLPQLTPRGAASASAVSTTTVSWRRGQGRSLSL